VIGKVHRLGLSGRAKSAAAPAAPRNAPPRKTPPRAPSHPMAAPAPTRGAHALAADFEAEAQAEVQPQQQQSSEDVVIPFSERVTIMDLREYMCRWPMGDPTTPEFRFCGARSQTGMPYCTHHARIAYQPAADRRRDRSRVRA
jgi:GcrA cell cycle regulator